MKNILTIFKKEWDRVIRDKRLVLNIMILPGLMIFLIYTFIGTALENRQTKAVYQVAIVNPTDQYQSLFESYDTQATLEVITITDDLVAEYEQKVDDGSWELVIILAPNLESYDWVGDPPSVTVYYNQNKQDSGSAYMIFISCLNDYQSQLSYAHYHNTDAFTIAPAGIAPNQSEQTGYFLSLLLPMLIVMFLFSGSISVGPESIAGEKERGTIATLLITPAKRSEIALGKILGLSVLSLLSSISSFLGIFLSLSKIMPVQSDAIAIYPFKDYVMLFVLMFSTVLVIVGMISIISAYAKTVKEATTMIMPLYIVTILVGVSSIFGAGAPGNIFLYLIPIYNTVQSITAILTFDPNAFYYIIVTAITNLVIVGVLAYVLNRMFMSEKIMFAK